MSKGVYTQAKPMRRVDHGSLYVPPVLSKAFWRFMMEFLRDPSANALFLREWRRRAHYIGGLSGRMMLAAVLAAAVICIMGIGLIVLFLEFPIWKVYTPYVLTTLFYLPVLVGNVLAFFVALGASQQLSSRAMLQELALTRLSPQEIVFGQLTGGLAPLALPLLLAIPALGLVGFDLAYRQFESPIMALPVAMGMMLWFVPNAVSSLLGTGALVACVTFGVPGQGKAMTRGLLTWLLAGAGLMAMPTIYAWFSYPFGFLVATPILIALRLLLAGAFMHHLAVRVAEEAFVEKMALD